MGAAEVVLEELLQGLAGGPVAQTVGDQVDAPTSLCHSKTLSPRVRTAPDTVSEDM